MLDFCRNRLLRLTAWSGDSKAKIMLLLLLVALTGCSLVPHAGSFTPAFLWRNNIKNEARIVAVATSQEHYLLPLSASTTAPIVPQASDNINNMDGSGDPRVGVLLLNLGGPETGDDVEGFLYNLFADPDIIRLPNILSPLQLIIAWIIAKRRAPQSRAAYESIGGGSPILRYSQQQAKLLCESVKKRYGMTIRSYIGMRYWHPFTDEALQQIRQDEIDALVIIPLYPQFSISTSGSSLRVLQQMFAASAAASMPNDGDVADSANYSKSHNNNKAKNSLVRESMVHTVVPSWYNRPGYIQSMVNLVQHELDSFTEQEILEARTAAPDQKPLHVLFSAHGVPASYILKAGDPYQKQIEECVQLISQYIENDTTAVHLSYQSRVGPIEWLQPYTDYVLPQLGEANVKNLVVVPISFVSEHVETLEEIDMEYRELAEKSGITNWRRCPALNTDPRFIDDMADMVMEALAEPRQSVTEVCVANNVGGDFVESPDTILNGVGVMETSGDYRSGQRQLKVQGQAMLTVALVGLVSIILFDQMQENWFMVFDQMSAPM